MNGFPIHIITSYRAGKISRQQFIRQFIEWQKSHGINYDCRGIGGKGWLGLTYRGENAVIKNGVIEWVSGEYRDPKKGNRRFIRNTAENITEFKRKVDIAICDRLRGTAWN